MILFYLLLGYLLFRFVVGFLIPVFRTTKQMKDQFSQMNRQQQGPSSPNGAGAGRTGTAAETNSQTRQPDASKVGEYIDFEEVKQ